jgi:lipoyl(octanoyl) transferase
LSHCPPRHRRRRDTPSSRQTEDLYLAFHQSLVDILAKFDIVARCREQAANSTNPTAPTASEPFLCFQRATFGDVLVSAQNVAPATVGTHKIAGSAQRRRRRAVLQHGSILLQKSSFAPELPGIGDLTGVLLEADSLLESWVIHLARVLQLKINDPTAELSPAIVAAAEQIRTAKFAHPGWTEKR